MKRITWKYDTEAAFEECNGESRPLTEAEYAENRYRACPQHPRAGSTVLDSSVSPNVVGCAICGNTAYEDIAYAEYLAYYGDPDKHVYVGCVVEEACGTCGSWQVLDSLWSIDFMDGAPELSAIVPDVPMTEEAARALPGYAGEVVRELLD